MNSPQSAEQFYENSSLFYDYAGLVLYSYSALFTVIASVIMHVTQGWHNSSLVLLLANIFVYAISSFIACFYLLGKPKFPSILYSLEFTAANFCHWIITAIYVKASFETRMLINKNTYIGSAVDLV